MSTPFKFTQFLKIHKKSESVEGGSGAATRERLDDIFLKGENILAALTLCP